MAVQVDPGLPALGCMRLQLINDEPLSNFAFNFNLRRYHQVVNHFPNHYELTRKAGGLLRTSTPPTLALLLLLLLLIGGLTASARPTMNLLLILRVTVWAFTLQLPSQYEPAP
jgi:hypothetical protein